MRKEIIKVGFCVAYDWSLLRYAIPQIYQDADVICLSLDRNRQSWSGMPFSWDEDGFRKLVAALDPLGKIKVYEDDFYVSDLGPMQNEVRQRNMIASFLGEGGWHVQLDADEYFLDFAGFTAYLQSVTTGRTLNICCPLINLYKQADEGMLWIKPERFSQVEYFPLASRFPRYEYGRRNGYFNMYANYVILHQSWARSEEEIWEKLNNWGHALDFNVKEYFDLWKEANGKNYATYKNFHHLKPASWPALALKEGTKDIEDLLKLPADAFPLPITKSDLRKTNSLFLSRINAVLNKMK